MVVVKTVTPPGADQFDLLELPFLTIGPAESMDFDQTMHLERERDGYRVWYAIADVPAFVVPGGAIDTEARARPDAVPPRMTVFCCIRLSLARRQRACCRTGFAEHSSGHSNSIRRNRVTKATHTRTRVRSHAHCPCEQVQKALDDGTAGNDLVLLEGGRPEAPDPGAGTRWRKPRPPRPGGQRGRRSLRVRPRAPSTRRAGTPRSPS